MGEGKGDSWKSFLGNFCSAIAIQSIPMNKQSDMFLQFSKQGCNSFQCVHVTLHMGSHGFTAACYLHWIAHGGAPAVHSSSLHDTGKLGGHHRKDKD